MPIPLPARRRIVRLALLVGVSSVALAAGRAAVAAGPPTFSPAWYTARAAAARAMVGTAAASATASLSQVRQSLTDMTSAAAAIRGAALMQAQARLRGAMESVPDGLAPGGLVPATGANAEWVNAAAPAQTGPATRPVVSVTQTGSQAILNWRTFNVGAHTTLAFNQSAGGANASGWVVLNRVVDPAAQPSQILGAITAPGKVFILNANGIIFGAGSQVSVGALLAAAATMTDSQFVNSGIDSTTDSGGALRPSFTGAAGEILVEAGAHLQTNPSASVLTGGGAVILLGANVENDGEIDTPGGQTVLAAGQSFTLQPGYSVVQNADGSLSGNLTSTTLGTEVAVSNTPVATGAGAVFQTGSVINTGLITSTTGDISLIGQNVAQDGVVVATTSVNQRGTVHLLTETADGLGTVTLGANSLTTVQLDTSGATALDSSRAGKIAQSASSNALLPAGTLPDELYQSRIEITTGGLADLAGGSLTMAQGGRVAISAGQRTYIGSGAIIDTSGVVGVTLPASAQTVVVNVQGFEQRDAPLNRDAGGLDNANITLDINDLVLVPNGTGGYTQGDRYYTAGGLLEVSGYLNTTQHTIGEWASVGGTIDIASAQVIAQPSSVLNVAGGSLNYQGGLVGVSYLIGPGGVLYNAATAPANLLYTGVYGGQTLDHAHWGFSEVFRNPLVAPSEVYEPANTVGRDAGSVIIAAPTALLDGAIDAGVVAGPRQVGVRPAGVTDSYMVPHDDAPLGGTLDLSNPNALGAQQTPFDLDFRIADTGPSVAATLGTSDPVPADRIDTVWLTPGQIAASGLSSLTVVTAGRATVAGTASLAPGGTVSITAPVTDFAAGVIARSGSVIVDDGLVTTSTTLQLQYDGTAGITLENGVSLDTRGLWVNALTSPTGDRTGSGFINGGTVSLTTARSIVLDAGSAIDVSAGAAISSTGSAIGGGGGNLTLDAVTPNDGATSEGDPHYVPPKTPAATTPGLILNGALRGYAVTAGGTLTLVAPAIQIGASATAAAATTLVLSPAITSLGFQKVVLNGQDGVTVTDGTTLSAAAPSYQLALYDPTVPTGGDPADAMPLILPPLFTLNPTTAKVTQRAANGVSLVLDSDRVNPSTGGHLGGPITVGLGAVITVDPTRSVTLETTNARVTVLGTITAPAGTIELLQNAVASADVTAYPDPGLSVWLGSASRLDVAGEVASGRDTLGRPYALTSLLGGGSVVIGASGTLTPDPATTIVLPAAAIGYVAIRAGAVIDASGAGTTIDELAGLEPLYNQLAPGQVSLPVVVGGAGGTVAIASAIGIGLDGRVVAPSGGPRADGGTLELALQTPVTYAPPATAKGVAKGTLDPALLVPRSVVVSATSTASLPANLAPGDAIPAASIGQAPIGVDQIVAGGFTNVALFSSDSVAFNGAVNLTLGHRLEISAATVVEADNDSIVTLSAPYVAFGGAARGTVPQSDPGAGQVIGQQFFYPGLAQVPNGIAFSPGDVGLPADTTQSSAFVVNAGFVEGSLQLGLTGVVFGAGTTETPVDLPAPRSTVITSAGDLRAGTITTAGDLQLVADQILPLQTTANATSTLAAGGTLSIGRSTTAAPPEPLDLAGTLELQAPTIEQGGIVRAALGDVLLSGPGGGTADLISFLPGSITSVSAAGISTLYGGTTDGVNYAVDGTLLTTTQTNGQNSGSYLRQTVLSTYARSVVVSPGATLDVSGGGNIQGAGFISGRGGSTDTLLAPSLQFNAAAGTVSSSSGGVYAIVAGAQPGFGSRAPATQNPYTGSMPSLGQQIVLSQPVDGLPAGTYTLLPAYYALLPGGYRVQLSTAATRVTSAGARTLADGTVVTSASLTIAGTAISGALPVQITLNTGAQVRDRSEYDEQNLTQFTQAQASLFGQTRDTIPADGGLLLLQYPGSVAGRAALSFQGTALFAPGAGGVAGAAAVDGPLGTTETPLFEVVGNGATATPGYVTLAAADLDAMNAPRLSIGGFVSSINVATLSSGPSGNFQTNATGGVVIRGGATLAAGEVFLLSNVTLQAGAVIDTIGEPAAPYDSSLVGAYSQSGNNAVVAVSNGELRFAPATGDGNIEVDSGATLLAEGSIGFVTTGQLDLPQGVTFGARYISFATSSANIGTAAQLTSLTAGNLLPTGVDLSAEVLTRLLLGDPAVGAPALEHLTLTASKSVNFVGSVTLDTTSNGSGTSSLQDLVVNTPAIYGLGGASDVASLTVGTFYWNGVRDAATGISALPGGVVAGGPGSGAGTLDIRAGRIVLGFSPDDQPNDQLTLDRVTFGFGTVNLIASQDVEGNNLSSLSVYQQQQGIGFTGTGGVLNLVTPLLTGAPGSVLSLTAGGALSVAPAAGVAPSQSVPDALGAEIHLTAPTVAIDSAVVAPSGGITVTTTGDIAIGAGARLDVAGRPKTFFDQTEAGVGGTIALESDGGSIRVDPTASIAIGAVGANAGALSATASAGTVDLAGPIAGAATGGFQGGTLDLRAKFVPDFTGLNTRLNQGGVTGARSFDIKTGDITVANVIANGVATALLKANTIVLSVDGGALTIDGLVDASGAAPGSISLAGADGLTLTANATLDAHATLPWLDSYGAPIDSENRAEITLTAGGPAGGGVGTLTIAPGAALNVSAAAGVSCLLGTAACGTVVLNAPQLGAGDIAVSVPGAISVAGAQSIALYATTHDVPADGTIAQTNLANGAPIDPNAIGLDQIDAANTVFMNAAVVGGALNTTLASKLAGLAQPYAAQFHLRPGVEIDSPAASSLDPTAALYVPGDLDLSGLRYVSLNPATQKTSVHGSGEPGSLTLRAAGDLVINGSVTDGFAPPPSPTVNGTATLNPSDNGWIVYTPSNGTVTGEEPFGADIVLPYSLPAPVQLLAQTVFQNTNTVLGYAIAIGEAGLAANKVLPQAVTLASAATLTAETTLTAPITLGGAVLYQKGQIVPAGTTIPAGATVGAGTVLPVALDIQAGTWQAGGNLDLFTGSVKLTQTATLTGGSLIPSGTKMVLASDGIPTRPTGAGGAEGQVWAAAPMLPAGSLSWSLRLVSGADLTAADSTVLQPAGMLNGGGDTVLSDTHYTLTTGRRNKITAVNPSFSVIRTGTGDLDLLSGGSITESSLYGIYTAGTQSPAVGGTISGGVDTLDQGRNVFDLARGETGGTVLGPNGGVYESLVDPSSEYAAYYPQGGGNLTLVAQGNITGDIHGGASVPNTGDTARESGAVDDFLWQQGGGTAVDQATAWWINFGTYVVNPDAIGSDYPSLVGFVGVGTLGGGNVTVAAGGNIGAATDRGDNGQIYRSGGLDATVASTGRVVGGTLVQTGGGDLSISAGGAVNPGTNAKEDDLNGTWTDTRGTLTVNAGAIGQVVPDYSNGRSTDPRLLTNVAEEATASGGPVLVLGDSVATLDTRRDLTLSGVGDPGRIELAVGSAPNLLGWNTTPYTYTVDGQATFAPGGGNSFFSLWTDTTGIVLDSAGGNITPFSVDSGNSVQPGVNDRPISGSAYYIPGSLTVLALDGSIYDAAQVAGGTSGGAPTPFELAPSPVGELQLLAGDSIYNLAGTDGLARAWDMSGASVDSIASIDRPAFNNISPGGTAPQVTNEDPNRLNDPILFAFTDPDTPTDVTHADDTQPNRVYAVAGDIVGLLLGEELTPEAGFASLSTEYRAAKPEAIRAGRDIVEPGIPNGDTVVSQEGSYDVTGDFVLNLRATDVSIVSAGRDIIYANFQVAGPGSLLVSAGRNLYQANQGVLESIGPVINPDPQSRSDGANILALAGVGANGPDWTAFAEAYLDPDKLAVPGVAVGSGVNADRVAATYSGQLLAWLQQNYGYTGTAEDALATFLALPVEQQGVFLAPIYFDELRLSGREYNDPTSVRYKSYARGREAAAILFPTTGAGGAPITYSGALTLFSANTEATNAGVATGATLTTDGGIRTDRGGSLVVLDPGGGVTVGVTGITPGADSGLLTQGSGDIDIYALGSVLLGESRVFTTFGGGITIWSAQGDINAGRGAKTTVVSAPEQILYDDTGTALLSPTVPVTGAGIATLNPIASVPPGDVDLVAPLGVIDAGEAGIRASGNANLAALTVVNAGNIQVQGKTTGVPVIAVPNIGALTAAQAAAGSAQQSTDQEAERKRKASETIITVEVLGFGQ
jgi:filamentous hemagglutinin family protein